MRQRLPERLTAQLLEGKAPLPAMLTSRDVGIYALWLGEDAYAALDLESGLHGIAYVGVGAGDGGVARRFEEEWRPDNSGRSSPRRTLGALLLDELGLKPYPRPTRTAAPDPRYFCFEGSGEWVLTNWIECHASFSYVLAPYGEDPVVLEGELIRFVRPPLNLNKWQNPARPRLRAARDAATMIARQAMESRLIPDSPAHGSARDS